MRDVAIVSFAQSGSLVDVAETETQMLFPVINEAIERSGIPRADIGFTCSGSADYLAGTAVRLRRQPRGGGRLAADLRVPRRHGRRLGALRGVGAAPARRRRRRPRLLVGHLLAQRPARGPLPAERPVLPDAAVGRPHLARRPPGPGAARRRHRHRGRLRRGGGPLPPGRAWPTPSPRCRATSRADELLAEPYTVAPAPGRRLPARLRRRRRRDPGGRRPGPRGVRAPGVDPRHRPPQRSALPGRARPAPRRARPASPPSTPASATRRSRWPSWPPRSATRSCSCARRSAWATTSRSTRPAGRSPGNPLMVSGLDPHRRGLPADQRARPAPHGRPRRVGPVPAAEPGVRPGR